MSLSFLVLSPSPRSASECNNTSTDAISFDDVTIKTPSDGVPLLQHVSFEIGVAARFGDQHAVQRVINMYESMERDPHRSSIPVELRAPIYDNAVRQGSDEHYHMMLARFRRLTGDVSEKNRCMNALAASRLPHLIRHTLAMTLTDEIRSQDGISVIRSVARNSVLSLTQ